MYVLQVPLSVSSWDGHEESILVFGCRSVPAFGAEPQALRAPNTLLRLRALDRVGKCLRALYFALPSLGFLSEHFTLSARVKHSEGGR